MATLTKNLLKPVRERSGSVASNRFDYQKDWSLCKLLEIHESGKSYVLIFEHDEDLIILDSENNPKKIDFYQIKTKNSGEWRVSDLIRSNKKDTGSSFLGKLYSNKIKYGQQTGSLNFVSNAKFNIELKKGGNALKYIEVCVVECSDKEMKKISAKLKKEYSLKNNPESQLIFLKVTDLSLHDSGTHTTGKISKFLSKLNPEKKYQPELAYRMIFDEIKRKSNYEYECKTINELKQNKSIGKKEFTDMLNVIGGVDKDKNFEDNWDITQQRLNQEKEDLRVINKIKSAWIRYETKVFDHSDDTHKELCLCIKKIISGINKKVESLKDFLENVLKQYKATEFNKNHQKVYDDEYINAVTLAQYYERK
jgi:hypothetical protein